MNPPPADEVDRRIIDHLRDDGRRSFRKIAADLQISESTVRARYARLSSLGIVQVVGLSDLHTVGTVEGHVSVQVIGAEVRALARRLALRPEIRLVAEVVGAADLLLDVVFPSHAAFHRFIQQELPSYTGVRRIDFLQLRELVKDSYVWVDQP